MNIYNLSPFRLGVGFGMNSTVSVSVTDCSTGIEIWDSVLTGDVTDSMECKSQRMLIYEFICLPVCEEDFRKVGFTGGFGFVMIGRSKYRT